jgi:hypothetical protein
MENIMKAPFTKGSNVFLRKITMILTGHVEDIWHDGSTWWIELTTAAWIADTGRYSQAVQSGRFSEVEPYAPDQIVKVPLSDLIDGFEVTWALPTEQK